eukprot:scaffold1161_cov32-Phaeocystis_antarctica.AAC.1
MRVRVRVRVKSHVAHRGAACDELARGRLPAEGARPLDHLVRVTVRVGVGVWLGIGVGVRVRVGVGVGMGIGVRARVRVRVRVGVRARVRLSTPWACQRRCRPPSRPGPPG